MTDRILTIALRSRVSVIWIGTDMPEKFLDGCQVIEGADADEFLPLLFGHDMGRIAITDAHKCTNPKTLSDAMKLAGEGGLGKTKILLVTDSREFVEALYAHSPDMAFRCETFNYRAS